MPYALAWFGVGKARILAEAGRLGKGCGHGSEHFGNAPQVIRYYLQIILDIPASSPFNPLEKG
jgi:hypothetical protein